MAGLRVDELTRLERMNMTAAWLIEHENLLPPEQRSPALKACEKMANIRGKVSMPDKWTLLNITEEFQNLLHAVMFRYRSGELHYSWQQRIVVMANHWGVALEEELKAAIKARYEEMIDAKDQAEGEFKIPREGMRAHLAALKRKADEERQYQEELDAVTSLPERGAW